MDQDTKQQGLLAAISPSILNNLPDAVAYHKIVVDDHNTPIDYIFLDFNKKFEQFTGLKKENTLNKKVTEAIPGIKEAKPDLISLYGKVAQTGESSTIEIYFEPLKRWFSIFAFSPEKDYFVAIFTDITEKKTKEEELRRNTRALKAISECSQTIIHGGSENEILQKICEKIIDITGYKLAWVGQPKNNEEKTVIPIAQAGFEEGYLNSIKISWADNEFGRGPTGLSIRNREVAVMQNMATNPNFTPWREQALKRGYASSICLPLIISDDVLSLCIYATEADAFDEEEIKLLQELASDLAHGILTIRAQEERDRLTRAFRTISECNAIIIHETDEAKLIQKICDSIIKNTGYIMAWVGYGENDEAKSVKKMGYAGFEDDFLQKSITWADTTLGQRPIGIVIRTGQMYRSQNITTDPLSPEWKIEASKRGYKSVLALPLNLIENKGGIIIFSNEPNAFNDEEVRLLTELTDDLAFGILAIRAKTKREEAEKAKRELEEKFVKAFNSSPLSITIANLENGKLVDANPAFEKLTGYSINEALGKTGNELNLYPDPKERERMVEEIRKNQKARNIDLVLRDKKGAIHNVKVSSDIMKLGNVDHILSTVIDVTGEKKTEATLMHSEQRLNEAQRIGRIGSWEWDAINNKIWWSDEQYILFGLKPNSPTPNYEEHLKLYTDESAKRLDEAVKRATTTGEAYELTLEVSNPITTRWLIARGEVVRDQEGKITGLRGTAQDITSQKENEEKIRQAGVYNRNLIETSLDPMLTVNSEGDITDVNHAFELATGLTKEKLVGTQVNQYFTNPTKVTEGLKETVAKGFVRDYRVAIKNQAGNSIDCVWNTILYKDEKGEVQGIFAAARDITQLKKTEVALKEAEERYKTYIENSSDIIYAIDATGLIKYMSPQCKQFGLEPEELIDKVTIESLIYPPDKEEFIKNFKKNTTQPQGTIIFRFQDKNQHIYWLEGAGTNQFDANGNFAGAIGVVRDITERKLAEDRLKELDSIKSRFIRVVSHQLRTPLSAMRWQLESMLNEPGNLSELQKQMLHESYRADLDIISTINDLTTALDIEEGRAAHLDKTPNSLLSLWDSIEIDFVKKCQTRNITLETKKPTVPLPLIDMDTEKIRGVMEKLADNALNYTKEKGKITVEIEKIDSKLLFKISDTGIGIPETEKNYIMQRFYRGSNATAIKPDAAGLGLYISKNFVISHGGKIGFTSEEGKGSTFWFELPINQE